MKQLFNTTKSVDTFIEDFQKVMPEYSFGLQHIHNPPEKMRDKGIDFNKECKILDICNPHIANEVLSADLSLSCIMPCKIAVYSENGETTIALNSFVQMIDDLNPDLIEIAQDVQTQLIEMVEKAS